MIAPAARSGRAVREAEGPRRLWAGRLPRFSGRVARVGRRAPCRRLRSADGASGASAGAAARREAVEIARPRLRGASTRAGRVGRRNGQEADRADVHGIRHAAHPRSCRRDLRRPAPTVDDRDAPGGSLPPRPRGRGTRLPSRPRERARGATRGPAPVRALAVVRPYPWGRHAPRPPRRQAGAVGTKRQRTRPLRSRRGGRPVAFDS